MIIECLRRIKRNVPMTKAWEAKFKGLRRCRVAYINKSKINYSEIKSEGY